MNNPWGFKKANWKEGKPLGKSASDFIFENPEWILYLRVDRRFPCINCYDSATKSRSKVACQECWSTGFKVTPQVVPCRLVKGTGNLGAREGDQRVDPGYMEEFKTIVVFPRMVYPELEDLVLTCEWDIETYNISSNNRPKPIKVTGSNQIKQINSQFERQVSWFSCGLESLDFDANALLDSVRNVQDLQVLDADNWNTTFW